MRKEISLILFSDKVLIIVTFLNFFYRKIVNFNGKLTLFYHSEPVPWVIGGRMWAVYHKRVKKSLTTKNCYSNLNLTSNSYEFVSTSLKQIQDTVPSCLLIDLYLKSIFFDKVFKTLPYRYKSILLENEENNV